MFSLCTHVFSNPVNVSLYYFIKFNFMSTSVCSFSQNTNRKQKQIVQFLTNKKKQFFFESQRTTVGMFDNVLFDNYLDLVPQCKKRSFLVLFFHF